MKKFFFSIIILFFIIFINQFIFSNSEIGQKDLCLASGICVENLELNTEFGKIIINKDNCLKYNWEWNEEKRFCDVND